MTKLPHPHQHANERALALAAAYLRAIARQQSGEKRPAPKPRVNPQQQRLEGL